MLQEVKKIVTILTILSLTFYSGLVTGLYYGEKEARMNDNRLKKVEVCMTDLMGKVQALETMLKRR